MQTKISATIVADSLSPQSHRITTMVLVMPRYILAEFNTHRMFSRNSASSRAIPFIKMVEAVQQDPFIPLAWYEDHKGMQANTLLTPDNAHWCQATWLVARDYAVQQAKILNNRYGLTKQICNRLLEPYMWHTVLVTATEWENFFNLRANKAADIHMQILASSMLEAMNASNPIQKKEGEWHIPFGDDIDEEALKKASINHTLYEGWKDKIVRKIAVARAARISYTLPNSPNKHDYEKDIKQHDNLQEAGHVSPFEHCAQCPTYHELTDMINGSTLQPYPDKVKGWWGNFHGWKQYRKMLLEENRTDLRLKKHFIVEDSSDPYVGLH